MDEGHERHEAMKSYGLSWTQFSLTQGELLLRFGRAFADPMRIRILALLAERSLYGQELAEVLEVSTPTISHHISLLKGAGLIRVRRENSYHHYELDTLGLQKITEALTVEHLRELNPAPIEQPTYQQQPSEEVERKMVQEAFFKQGRLVSIPPFPRQKKYAMEIVAQAFAPGRIYEEKEVNAILKLLHPETATLRRELIDQRILLREDGRYWLASPSNGATGEATSS